MMADAIAAVLAAVGDIDGVTSAVLSYAPRQLRSDAGGIRAYVVPATATFSQVIQRRRLNELTLAILLTAEAGPEEASASTDLLEIAEAIMAELAPNEYGEYHVTEQTISAIADERLIGSNRIHVLQLSVTLKQESTL